MQSFEKFVGDKLKKAFPVCISCNHVENLGDWIVFDENKCAIVVECKDWDKFTYNGYKRKQPKQAKMLKKLPSVIIVRVKKDTQMLEWYSPKYETVVDIGPIKTIIEKIKGNGWESHYID